MIKVLIFIRKLLRKALIFFRIIPLDSGTFAKVELSQFVVAAKYQLFGNADGADCDLWLNKLSNDAIFHLDRLQNIKKRQCTLHIEDHKAKLPNGFLKLLAARFSFPNAVSGNPSVCGSMIYVDIPFLTKFGVDCNNIPFVSNLVGTLEIQDGYLYVHNFPTIVSQDSQGNTIITEQPVHDLKIAYVSLNVDENGLMIGYDDMERAIVAYICWRYCLQNMDIPKFSSQMNYHRQEWVAQKDFLKGKDFKADFHNNHREIASWVLALISDKSGFGLI